VIIKGAEDYFIYLLLLHRFDAFDPSRFRIGDIVEVQTNITMVALRNGRFKMIAQLRSIAQLDSAYSHVSAQQKHCTN